MLFYCSIILVVFTLLRYSNNVNFAKNVTPSFFLENEFSTHTFFNVAGVIKPGSISIVRGSDEMSFVITDYEHQLSIYYKGILPMNFLEGNTCIATGTVTDKDNPTILLANKLATDHGYNNDKWLCIYPS